MGTYRFICKNIKHNNGIKQVHLTSDPSPGSQPTELLWNGVAEEFIAGAEYTINVVRNLRTLPDMEN
jgi:hypothetical protein